MSVPRDNAVNNFRAARSLACGKLFLPGGVPGSVASRGRDGAAGWHTSPIPTATIPCGVTPAGMAVTPDGRYLYVANNNNYGTVAGQYVTVIDLNTNSTVANVQSNTFNQPYTVTISPDGERALFTNSAGQTITAVSTVTNTVLGTIGGFDGPSGLAIVGNVGYVNNYGATPGVGSGNGTTISILNFVTRTIVGTITTDQAPAALALSPDSRFLYVVNYVDGNPGTGTLQEISTNTNQVTRRLTGFSGPFGIAIHPDGTRAYVTNFGSNNFDPFGVTLSVVDLTDFIIAEQVFTGIQPSGVAVSPDGKYVYVSNYNTLYQVGSPTFSGLTAGQGTVVVMDAATNQLIPGATVAVGQSPANLVVKPDGSRVYVSNYTSNTVDVLLAL